MAGQWILTKNTSISFFFVAQQPLVGQGILTVEVLRSHSDTTHSLGLPWKKDQYDTETSTYNTQHSQETDVQCVRWHSNPQFQQVSSPRPAPFRVATAIVWKHHTSDNIHIIIFIAAIIHFNIAYVNLCITVTYSFALTSLWWWRFIPEPCRMVYVYG